MEDFAGLEEDFFGADLGVVLLDAIAEFRMEDGDDSGDENARTEDDGGQVARGLARLRIGRHSAPIALNGGH